MSQSEVIYVKGMNDTESDGDDEDIWDDKKLNDAYDKALRIANAEVAKRVAMATNSHGEKADKKGKSGKKKNSSKKNSIPWKSGMACRAVYDGDGIEYEAHVLRVINDKECVVKFLGYDNSEIVPLDTLKSSLGDNVRTRQIEQALMEKADDGFGSQSPDPDAMELGSDRIPSSASTDRSFQNKRTSRKKRVQKAQKNNNIELPELPMPMPDISMLRNLGSMDMPIPPPPMAFTARDRSDNEEQAISSMLLSWYMSGYYTGLYQGMRRAKENGTNK